LLVVRSNYSCDAAIVFEQASEPLATDNGVAAWVGFLANLGEKHLLVNPGRRLEDTAYRGGCSLTNREGIGDCQRICWFAWGG
jgi:hypothetical protein